MIEGVGPHTHRHMHSHHWMLLGRACGWSKRKCALQRLWKALGPPSVMWPLGRVWLPPATSGICIRKWQLLFCLNSGEAGSQCIFTQDAHCVREGTTIQRGQCSHWRHLPWNIYYDSVSVDGIKVLFSKGSRVLPQCLVAALGPEEGGRIFCTKHCLDCCLGLTGSGAPRLLRVILSL